MNIQDPVCGQTLTMADINGSTLHDGWAYYFCSQACEMRFREAPQSFADAPDPAKFKARTFENADDQRG